MVGQHCHVCARMARTWRPAASAAASASAAAAAASLSRASRAFSTACVTSSMPSPSSSQLASSRGGREPLLGWGGAARSSKGALLVVPLKELPPPRRESLLGL